MKQKIADYTDWLIERIADSTAAALADSRPAKVSWGRGEVGFVRNRLGRHYRIGAGDYCRGYDAAVVFHR